MNKYKSICRWFLMVRLRIVEYMVNRQFSLFVHRRFKNHKVFKTSNIPLKVIVLQAKAASHDKCFILVNNNKVVKILLSLVAF